MNFYRITVKRVNGPVFFIYRYADSFEQALTMAFTRINDKEVDLKSINQGDIASLEIEMRVQRVGSK